MNLSGLNFLAPGAFFLGLLLPVIVALYLLKLRRVERPVPSTFLWRKMVRDVEANAPWQKLRPNLLMILQLLFLIALIIALARPFTYAEGITGSAAIFIIDSSASMAATDVQPSRIESAKQRASQLIDELPGSARVTVIDAGKEAKVLASSSLDRRQAHLAVDGIQAGTGGSDMSVALELASAIAARQPGTEIAVFSDGRVELPQRIALKGKLRYIPFGLSAENQAISLLTLEPAVGGKTLTAFAQVSNYGDTRVDRRLSLYADGQLVNAFDLTQIPTGGQRSVIAEGLPPETRQIEARLDRSDPTKINDALPIDDQAFAVKLDTQPVPVTLVTQGNLFLKTALSLMPGVVLTEEESAPAPEGTPTAGPTPTAAPTPTATAAASQASGPAALTIYDNVLPDALPANGSLLFIAPPRSTEFFTTTGLVKNPALRVIDPNDPLAANIALDSVAIQEAVNIPLPAWATPVIAGDAQDGSNIPLLFRGEVNGRRIAVISFSTHVQNSDLALQVAFPLLVSNLVDWLVPGAGSAVPAQVAPGASLSFSAATGADSGAANGQTASVTRPDGSTVPLTADNGRFIFTDTNQLGVYHVNLPGENGAGRQAAFAVNLFSPTESAVKPADALPNVSAEAAGAGGASEKAAREWWRPLALLALGLLTGEWLVYQRASLVRLRDFLLRRSPALKFGRLK